MSQVLAERDNALVSDVRSYFERAAFSFDKLYNEDGQTPFWRWVNRQFRSDIVARFVHTCEHVRNARAGSVLDVGCGSGRYLAAFATLGVERLVGIDLSQPMLDLASQQIKAVDHPQTDLICANFDDYATDEKFDVVVAMGFFDYQADPVEVLAKMRSMARHSVIASFPSRHWFRTPLRQVRYKLKRCPVYFYGHDTIAELAERAGYSYIESTKLPGAGMDYVSVLRVDPPTRSEHALAQRPSARTRRRILAGALAV